jgi:hypothetical protein
MFSTGFSSGAFAGSGTRVMLGGTFSLRETCQPAGSVANTLFQSFCYRDGRLGRRVACSKAGILIVQ